MLSRRDFFRRAAVAASALAIADPEQLLWMPEAKTISIPRPIFPSRAEMEAWANGVDLRILRQYQRAYNLQLTATAETLSYAPLRLVPEIGTITIKWSDAHSAA